MDRFHLSRWGRYGNHGPGADVRYADWLQVTAGWSNVDKCDDDDVQSGNI